jgi:hypoxanthine phosphoribosyltransferase
MEPRDVEKDLSEVLYNEEQIHSRIAEICRQIEIDYAGKDLLLVGVLRGAVMVMADLARELKRDIEMDWMAVSSYGNSTESSGVVRIVKDLDTDLAGRNVLIVEDIVDSGLTLSWLKANLESRNPASLEICALLRKPEAEKVHIDAKYVGFDIPNAFVVGYGLDYAERYRYLRAVAVLAPHVYA